MPLLFLTEHDWNNMKASIDKLAITIATFGSQIRGDLSTLGVQIMTDLSGVTSQITALQTAVSNEQTVESSAVALIQGMTQTLTNLQAQIATLSAGTVTQAQLDDLSSQVAAQVTALNANAGNLASAVAANQPTPQPTPPSPAPQSARR